MTFEEFEAWILMHLHSLNEELLNMCLLVIMVVRKKSPEIREKFWAVHVRDAIVTAFMVEF